MKNMMILLILAFFYSCEKCEIYDYVIEDNIREAQFKCTGVDNDFPDIFREESRVYIGELCGNEREDLPIGIIQRIEICEGVTATVRARFEAY